MAKRREFTKATKKKAFVRSVGVCENHLIGRPCDVTFSKQSDAEYHHIHAAFLDGYNDVDNCACLCPDCHAAITKRQKRDFAQTRRFEKERRGERKRARRGRAMQSRPMQKSNRKIQSRPMPKSGRKIPSRPFGRKELT